MKYQAALLAFLLSACSSDSYDQTDDALELLRLSIKCPVGTYTGGFVPEVLWDDVPDEDFSNLDYLFVENKFSGDKTVLILQKTTTLLAAGIVKKAMSVALREPVETAVEPHLTQVVAQVRVPYKQLQTSPLGDAPRERDTLTLICDCTIMTNLLVTGRKVESTPIRSEQKKEFKITFCDGSTARNAFTALEILINKPE